MRAAEWINLLAFSFYLLLARYRRLKGRRLATVMGLGAAGLAATLAAAYLLPRLLPPLAASITRDWLPYPLLLILYWQTGQFFDRTDQALQLRLERIDRRTVLPLLEWCGRHRAAGWLIAYFEMAYLFCYPCVPLSLMTIYLLRRGSQADHFWTTVLGATYLCYGAIPFIQTLPPRINGHEWIVPAPARRLHHVNRWVLRRASIHANTFPSAHAASSTACALALLRLDPGPGMLFLALAASISAGAVLGRYHYLADVVLGAAVAGAVFLLQTRG